MNLKYALSALVPMKGNSERVPGKNIRRLGGVPLFYHILTALENAEYVAEIIVNTDSREIKELINKDFSNVVVIDRPDFLLGNKVPMTPIIEYDLKFIKTKHFLQTHATCPFIKPETIDSAINIYFESLPKGFDSVIGVNKYQTRFYDHNKKPINHNPDIMLPSQDMLPIYEDNSSFYINSIENFLRYKNRVGKNPFFVEISKLESSDIDEEDDFEFCEAMYEFINKNNK